MGKWTVALPAHPQHGQQIWVQIPAARTAGWDQGHLGLGYSTHPRQQLLEALRRNQRATLHAPPGSLRDIHSPHTLCRNRWVNKASPACNSTRSVKATTGDNAGRGLEGRFPAEGTAPFQSEAHLPQPRPPQPSEHSKGPGQTLGTQHSRQGNRAKSACARSRARSG